MAEQSNTAILVRVEHGQSPRLSKENIAISSPAANQVLVKVSHVAQNPTDGMPCNESRNGLIPAHALQYNHLMETLLATKLSLDVILSEKWLSWAATSPDSPRVIS